MCAACLTTSEPVPVQPEHAAVAFADDTGQPAAAGAS